MAKLGCRFLLFSVSWAHPCSTIALSGCLSTFLPSFLSDPRLAELKYCYGNGSFPSRAKEFGKKDDLNLTCTLERCRVMGEEFLEVEVQVTGF